MSSAAKKNQAEDKSSPHFLVTILSGPAGEGGRKSRDHLRMVKTEVWESESPLAIGHPFRWSLERTPKGVRIRSVDSKTDSAAAHSCQEVSESDIKKSAPILLKAPGSKGEASHYWVIINSDVGMPDSVISGDKAPQGIPQEDVTPILFERTFKMVLLQVFGGCVLFAIALVFLPKPQENAEEVIPPQFAKLLLKPAYKPPSGEAAASGGAESAQKRSVVQAFKSEAVQKSVKKLLNVKSLTALSKSNLLSGVGSKSTLDQVFNAKGAANPLAKLDTGALNPKSAEVGLIGGKGGKGDGTGYSTGSGAALKGQGNAQVDIGVEGLSVAEGLSRDEVGKAIRQHLGDIRYCYESALVRNPGVEGKLVVYFTIVPTGMVKVAEVKEGTSDAGLNQCIITQLKKWKFPVPKGGVEVGVTYPFIFKSLGG